MARDALGKRRLTPENRIEAQRHPLRGRILTHLIKEGPSSPSEMARVLDAQLDLVNYHTTKLVDLGCADLVDEITGKGPPVHIYRATEAYLVETDEWNALPKALKDPALTEFCQAHIDDMVRARRAGTLGEGDHFHLTQNRALVDEQGRRELLDLWEETREAAAVIQERSSERLLSGERALNMSMLLGCFELPLDDKASPKKT